MPRILLNNSMDAHTLSREGYIILDNHMHLREDGRFLSAIDMFLSAGGNSINLVNLPSHTIPPREYYQTLYEKTLRMASRIRQEKNMPVLVTLGPYPLDYFMFVQNSMDPVEEMKRGIDLAAKYSREGLCNAIGEVGRPHFPVPKHDLDRINDVLSYAMDTCADNHVPLILHTEDLSQTLYNELELMALRAGMKPEKVIKHHALPEDMHYGTHLRKSILASRNNVREAGRTGGDFFLETDYVDDPGSWKVIPPDSVPRRISMIVQEYSNWLDIISQCCGLLPREVYGDDAFAKLKK
ncbi:MAG: TatD family hydrolase [Candidatus Thermoplasmatota archaeon]|nr:TatD family hydrolase [Candidatus Thermoplasmatota archaeon]